MTVVERSDPCGLESLCHATGGTKWVDDPNWQLGLFADRTSAHLMRANQLRAYFSAFAGVLIQIIRQFGLKATEMERTQAGTICGFRRMPNGDSDPCRTVIPTDVER